VVIVVTVPQLRRTSMCSSARTAANERPEELRTMYIRAIGCLAAAACALPLVSAGTASARAGERTAAETYPAATAVCERAREGTLPPRLSANTAQVVAACDTLENAFGPLVTTVDNAESTYLGVLATQRGLVSTACARPVSDRATCITARETARTTDAAARATRIAAVAQFRASVESNRATFWATIESLRRT
jgi:hypothetical protein